MYVGSADFIAANDKPIQKHRITGTIDGMPFTTSNLWAGSMTVSNQCSDSTDAKIGAVFIGEFKATFINMNITPKTWRGRVITVNFGLMTKEDPETWEDFPLGIFTVSKAERTMDGVAVTAYDNMTKFDKPITWDYLPNGTLFTVLQTICTDAGVTLGMTAEDCAALPNGTENIGLYPGSDCQTFRDLLYWLSQMVAGFATIDRTGALVLRSYKTILEAPGDVPELPQGRRLMGAQISDYVTDFHGVTLYSMLDEMQYSYGAGGGIVYELGANPFIQYGTKQAIFAMAMRIAVAVDYKLRPFSASVMSAPIWELGDRLKLTEGIAAGYDSVTVIHSISYSPNKGTVIKCFGANPAQSAANVKDKAAAGAANSAKLAGTTYKRYANTEAITIPTTETQVAEIDFTAEKETDFEVWHEILLETDLDAGKTAMELEAVYYLDFVELLRKPVETYTDEGRHILTLNYSEQVPEGNHKWQVFLKAKDGTADIAASGAIAVLKGQGITKADGWNGIILLSDEVPAFTPVLQAAGLSDSAALTVTGENDFEKITGTDTVPAFDPGTAAHGMTEHVNIILTTITFPLAIQNTGEILAVENEDMYIETED